MWRRAGRDGDQTNLIPLGGVEQEINDCQSRGLSTLKNESEQNSAGRTYSSSVGTCHLNDNKILRVVDYRLPDFVRQYVRHPGREVTHTYKQSQLIGKGRSISIDWPGFKLP